MRKSLGAKTIVYPTPVFVVGSSTNGDNQRRDRRLGRYLLLTFRHACSFLRKATYTYKNIVERQAFTINIPSEDYAKEADYFGLASEQTRTSS